MATLGDIRSRVKFEVGNYQGGDSRIDDAINDAIIEIALTWKPQELIATATGTTSNQTAEYTFSSTFSATDVLAIRGVRNDTDDYRMKRGSLLEYLLVPRDTNEGSNFGRPNKWTRRGNSLVLYSQIPDSTSRTIRIYYVQRPTALSADADTFPLNREWERPTILLASAYLWASLNNTEKSRWKNTQYEMSVARRDQPEDIEDESPEVQLVPVANVGND